MRKLFILITFICSLMMSSVAHAEWTKVSVTKSHLSYVDLDSIRKYDGRVHYWSLRNFHKPQKTGFTSAQIYIEAECGRFRFRFLNVVTFEGPFASGKVLLATMSQKKTVMVGYDDIHSQCFKDMVSAYQKVRQDGELHVPAFMAAF